MALAAEKPNGILSKSALKQLIKAHFGFVYKKNEKNRIPTFPLS